jgi:hypothetical protein
MKEKTSALVIILIITAFIFSTQIAEAKGVVAVIVPIIIIVAVVAIAIVAAAVVAQVMLAAIPTVAATAVGTVIVGAIMVAAGLLATDCLFDKSSTSANPIDPNIICKSKGGDGGGGYSAIQVDVMVNGSDGPVTFGAPASFKIQWAIAGPVESCSGINNWSGNIGEAKGEAQMSDVPMGNYSYGIRCTGAGQDVSDSAIVNVVGVPTIDFKAPSPVEIPDPIKLFWATENADSCNASGDWSGPKQAGPLPYKTEEISKPRGSYTFILSCTGLGGNNSDTKNVQVIQVPRCSFVASPPTIILPASSTLSWNCLYADSCSIDQGIGSANKVSGTKDVRPSQATTYTLTCSGLDDSRSYQATVNVGFEPGRREVPPR